MTAIPVLFLCLAEIYLYPFLYYILMGKDRDRHETTDFQDRTVWLARDLFIHRKDILENRDHSPKTAYEAAIRTIEIALRNHLSAKDLSTAIRTYRTYVKHRTC